MMLSPRSLFEWFRPASAMSRASPFELGMAAYEGRQYLEAMMFWKLASEAGDAKAGYRMGLLYVRGEGVVRSVPDAVVWYEWAARLGNVEAQFQLGLIFLHGDKPPLGPYRHETWRQSSGVRLGEKATDIHHLVFPYGSSVERNVGAAFGWISAAAEGGKAEAL